MLLKAQPSARERAEGRVALVEEIFQGRLRPFPAAVDAALLGLSAARGSG